MLYVYHVFLIKPNDFGNIGKNIENLSFKTSNVLKKARNCLK